VPSSFDYEGRIVFTRTFVVEEDTLDRMMFLLRALGINYEAEVYINDYFVGKHTGGYTSFSLDVPDNVLQVGSENVLKIVVDNRLSARSSVPVRRQIWGWRNYGGILRDIYFRLVPRFWVARMRVTPMLSPDLKSGTVHVQATLSNQGFPDLVTDTLARRSETTYGLLVELMDNQSGAVVAQSPLMPVTAFPSRDLEVETSLPIVNPALWSPAFPHLYTVRATLVAVRGKIRSTIDIFARSTGFVQARFEGSRLLVNGTPTVLRGVAWHEDSPSHGASLRYEQMERELGVLKAMGVNAVRFPFHPPHPYVMDLCNRYGLFALVELPVWNVAGAVLGDDLFQELAEAQAREMVQRDRIAPSVLAWGIGDELDSADPQARFFVQRLVAAIKALDARPVYYGTSLLRNDVCADLADIGGINVPAKEAGDVGALLEEWKRRYPDKPLFVLRYGKTVASGNRNGYSDPMSEEAQARFFMEYHRVLRAAGVTGSFYQAFADWRGDRPIMTVEQNDRYLHPVGLLGYAREKRLAFDVFRQLLADQRVAALPIGKKRSNFPVVHILAGFVVIFLMAYQFHYNRRFNETFRRALLRSYNFFADLRDVHSVSTLHSLIVAFAVSLTAGTLLSALLHHYRTDVFVDYLLTQVVVSDALKEELIGAVWNPLAGVVAFSIGFFLLSLLGTLVVRLAALFVRRRVSLFHAYTAMVWGALPVVFLSPLAMSLFKLLANPFYVVPSFVVLLVAAVWVFLRVLKGVSVVFDVRPLHIYVAGFLLAGGVLAGGIAWLDLQYGLLSYLQFIVHLFENIG
jgi:hypothetical protein